MGQPWFLWVNPGESGEPGFIQINPRETGQPWFLWVNPGESGQPGFIQVNPGSSRSTRVHPGQPRFLQVNPGELAPDQSKIHITHCLHFRHHYEIVYLLLLVSFFNGPVHQMHTKINTLSLLTNSFPLFFGLRVS